MKILQYSIPLIMLVFLAGGCSFTKITADRTVDIMVKAAPTYDREGDLEFARETGFNNLKTLEGLLEVAPGNKKLLLLTSGSFTRYTFGFIEEQIEIADENLDFPEKEKHTRRAVDFYSRARAYGLRLLAGRGKQLPLVMNDSLELFSQALTTIQEKDVPALFWTAYAWGSIINLQRDDPARLAEIPRIDLMMQRVIELDESYYFAGAHLFYGVNFGGRPETLGGNPEKARQHFEKAIELTEGKYLMAKYLFAKYYAVQTQNRELFENILREVISAPDDLFPKQLLANKLAQRRAQRLLIRIEDFFIEDLSKQ